MDIPILSDKEKLHKWNDICIAMNWAQKGEMEKWFAIHGVLFTHAGSCIGSILSSLRTEDAVAAEQSIKASSGEAMATYVLQVLTGIMVFPSTDIETVFWKTAIERINLEWDLVMPPEIVPKRIRDILNYPKEEAAPEPPPELPPTPLN